MILCFHLVAMYFVDFKCFQKLTAKFQFHLNRFKISKFSTWQWRKLEKSILQLPSFEEKSAAACVADAGLEKLP